MAIGGLTAYIIYHRKKEIENKIGMSIAVKEIMDFYYHLRKGDIKIPDDLLDTFSRVSEKINYN